MRFLAAIPFLLVTASFIMSMLLIFAGNKPGFLENMDMLTLNVSQLGNNMVNTSKYFGNDDNNKPEDNSDDGIFGKLHDKFDNITDDAKDRLGNRIQQGLNDIVDTVAEKLNIHDFYSAHLMDYCEGYYAPSSIGNSTTDPWKNITRCSNTTSQGGFNPTAILQSELRSGVNLEDLKWPEEVETAIKAVEVAMKVMFILYCIGAGFAGLGLLGAIGGLFANGRIAAILNFMIDFIAFLALGIASAIATAAIGKIVDTVNEYGSKVGAAAYKGRSFLVMTWVATALLLIAAFVWIVDCCVGGGRRRTRGTSEVGSDLKSKPEKIRAAFNAIGEDIDRAHRNGEAVATPQRRMD